MGTEPTWVYWLHVAGQIAGVVLVLELWLALLIVCGMMIGLWLGVRWVRTHVVPIVDQYGAQARGALSVAVRGGDRIVGGVAEFRGRQEAVRAAIATFLLGPGHGYHEIQQEAQSPSLPLARSAHHGRGEQDDDVIERFPLRDDGEDAGGEQAR
jgi:hypothetical protein